MGGDARKISKTKNRIQLCILPPTLCPRAKKSFQPSRPNPPGAGASLVAASSSHHRRDSISRRRSDASHLPLIIDVRNPKKREGGPPAPMQRPRRIRTIRFPSNPLHHKQNHRASRAKNARRHARVCIRLSVPYSQCQTADAPRQVRDVGAESWRSRGGWEV